MQNYLENFSSVVIFAAIEHFLFRGSDFLQKNLGQNLEFFTLRSPAGASKWFFKKLDLTSEGPFNSLSNKPSIIENGQEIRKFSLYCLIRSILTKFVTFEGAWLRPQKGRGLKCIFFGISVQNSTSLYGLFLDSRYFFQMRTVVRVLHGMLLKLTVKFVNGIMGCCSKA